MILFEHGPGAGPVLFEHPMDLILAWSPDQVPAALSAMAAARAAGRWLAGYVSYELGYVLEPRLRPLLPVARRAPLLAFEVHAGPTPADAVLAAAAVSGGALPATMTELVPAWSAAEYGRAFDRVAAWIAAGDCYQVNLTMPMTAVASGPALGLYAALARVQPVRHGAFVDIGVGPVVLSRSPELFFRLSPDGTIETRPMKGTVPRDSDPERDQALKTWLRNSAKNRAENLMIVDLLRNDISRLCEVGTVRVPELFRVETYATLHQMISRVVGQTRPGTSIEALFRALFPCGSVTGAPKIRAMQIIAELEPHPRDVYCGGIGWIAPDGAAEFNVAIRTLSLFDRGGGDGWDVVMNVGGGVIHDSTAAAEYEEALWKARFAHLT